MLTVRLYCFCIFKVRKTLNDLLKPVAILIHTSQDKFLLSESSEPALLYPGLLRLLLLNTHSELYLLVNNDVWNTANSETAILSLWFYLWSTVVNL